MHPSAIGRPGCLRICIILSDEQLERGEVASWWKPKWLVRGQSLVWHNLGDISSMSRKNGSRQLSVKSIVLVLVDVKKYVMH